MTFDLPSILGLAGAALFLAAYGGVQIEKLDPLRPPALLMNLAGAILILISLAQDFNLAAFILEGVWGLIALFGLIKYAVRRRR